MNHDPCDYSNLSDREDTPPCWGDVTLIEEIEMSNGDRVAIHACGGHRGVALHGHYIEKGAPLPPVELDIPDELSSLWESDPVGYEEI